MSINLCLMSIVWSFDPYLVWDKMCRCSNSLLSILTLYLLDCTAQAMKPYGTCQSPSLLIRKEAIVFNKKPAYILEMEECSRDKCMSWEQTNRDSLNITMSNLLTWLIFLSGEVFLISGSIFTLSYGCKIFWWEAVVVSFSIKREEKPHCFEASAEIGDSNCCYWARCGPRPNWNNH